MMQLSNFFIAQCDASYVFPPWTLLSSRRQVYLPIHFLTVTVAEKLEIRDIGKCIPRDLQDIRKDKKKISN